MNKRPGLTRHIIEALVIGAVATGLSYYLGLQFNWLKSVSSFSDWLEVFAVFTSYVCTWLCVVERRINYPIGAISSVAYAWLFWKTGLIASAILNIYLVPQLVYGWFRWNRDEIARPVTHVKLWHWPIYLAISGVFYLGAVLLNHALNGTMAFTDGLILVGSILAQFLLDNKKLENWVVWFVVDIIATWEYFKTRLPLVGVQYVLFLMNAVYGYYIWKKSYDQSNRIRITDGDAAHLGPLAVDQVRSADLSTR